MDFFIKQFPLFTQKKTISAKEINCHSIFGIFTFNFVLVSCKALEVDNGIKQVELFWAHGPQSNKKPFL